MMFRDRWEGRRPAAVLALTAILATSERAPALATSPGTARQLAEPPSAALELVTPASGAVDLSWRTDDAAMYVVEKAGRVLRFDGLELTLVLDVTGLVSTGSEQGLLGLAFSPAGDRAYVDFTDLAGDTVVAELAVSPDGRVFDLDGMRTVLTVDQPYANHNGGDLTFGPDGMLYITMGDGGSGGDPDRRAQDLGDLLGKILRIDPAQPAGSATGGLGYTVPGDNPLVGVEGARGEVWAVGLRNPWRVSFDPETGDLWIADVGQGSVEEVNVAPATDGTAARGANFGWSAYEGNAPFNSDVVVDDHHAPIHTYDHSGGRCSVSGGARARGPAAGTLEGWYVFADYCSGEVFGLLPDAALSTGDVVPLATGSSVTAVIGGPDGTVYVLGAEGVARLQPQ
jgi:glucose/arabinose dehydrogenase